MVDPTDDGPDNPLANDRRATAAVEAIRLRIEAGEVKVIGQITDKAGVCRAIDVEISGTPLLTSYRSPMLLLTPEPEDDGIVDLPFADSRLVISSVEADALPVVKAAMLAALEDDEVAILARAGVLFGSAERYMDRALVDALRERSSARFSRPEFRALQDQVSTAARKNEVLLREACRIAGLLQPKGGDRSLQGSKEGFTGEVSAALIRTASLALNFAVDSLAMVDAETRSGGKAIGGSPGKSWRTRLTQALALALEDAALPLEALRRAVVAVAAAVDAIDLASPATIAQAKSARIDGSDTGAEWFDDAMYSARDLTDDHLPF